MQAAILRLLASQRNPDSFVAGADLLAAHGFDIAWIRREPGIHAAIVRQGGESTRLEWVRDADFRFFFPAIADPLFGYRLHVTDLATNKALAAAGRREPGILYRT